MIKLLVQNTKDIVTRENMKRIQKEFTVNQVILKGNWKFFEFDFDSELTNFTTPHGLGFSPTDAIQTQLSGAGGEVVFNWDDMDSTNLNISTTEACKWRGFIGRYEEDGGIS